MKVVTNGKSTMDINEYLEWAKRDKTLPTKAPEYGDLK